MAAAITSNTEEQPVVGGLLLVDKPAGISSFDVIRHLRRQTSQRKIGHAGTLDPMATGLMLMLFGRATKQAQSLTKMDKSYTAEITLGATSTTGDAEGELTPGSSAKSSPDALNTALTALTGEIQQIPPAHSAIKVNGVRAYKLARAGKTVVMPPRDVTIHALKLHSYIYPVITLDADVSSGTYIRTLAEDIGAKLGTGAYLSALRRTSVGDYQIADAAPLDAVTVASLERLLIKV